MRLSSRLSRLGAPASTPRHLREAVEADQVLSTGVLAGDRWVEADTHPLAASVHRWTMTNLITWPITGKMPQHLAEFTPKVSRRGPTPVRHADIIGMLEARFASVALASSGDGHQLSTPP